MKLLAVCLLLWIGLAQVQAAPFPDDGSTEEEATDDLTKRSGICSPGWAEVNGRCMRFIPKPMTWAKAEKNCLTMKANLASVTSAEEYHEIQHLISQATYQSPEAWLGGSNAQDKDIWLWSDGSPFQFTNWSPGEPRGYQHCLQMNYGGEKAWDDVSCAVNRPFVCAKKP